MAHGTFKILLLMKRRPGMSVEAFRNYYENVHVPLATRHGASMSRYVRRYLDPRPHPETGVNELPYGVIPELWFDDEATFRASLEHLTTSTMPDEVVDDERKLFDRSSFRIATVVECETDMASLGADPGPGS